MVLCVLVWVSRLMLFLWVLVIWCVSVRLIFELFGLVVKNGMNRLLLIGGFLFLLSILIIMWFGFLC